MSDIPERVGLDDKIMGSSICLATIIGRPILWLVLIMRRWIGGTSSGSISTPKSPRAIITASEASKIGFIALISRGFSSLETTQARPFMSYFAFSTSSNVCTKEQATQSTPKSRENCKSFCSFLG